MIKKLKIFSVVIFVSLLYCGILGIVFNSVSSVPVLSVNISDGVDMPIIMYHSVLKDTDLSGKYIVTPDTLKNDINFLKNKGYTFVSAQELIDYTNGTSKLPDKPVMLTFDDGFYNNYGYVMPILSEYDAKAVEQLTKMLEVFKELMPYFTNETAVKIEEITKNVSGITNTQKNYLLEIKAQADSFMQQLYGLKKMGFHSLKNAEKIADELKKYKIDLSYYSHLNSELSNEKVELINKTLDEVLEKAGKLQGEIAQQKKLIKKTIEMYSSEINEFLYYAGYKYQVAIEEENTTDYHLVLKHIEGTDNVQTVNEHLSYGERNAFALVLFMYSVLKENPDLVVLDDPISSFDGNKKFAIINMLFMGKHSLKNRTVLLLTHEFNTVIDAIYNMPYNFNPTPTAAFLTTKQGILQEKEITKADIKSFGEIAHANISSDMDSLNKLVYLRRLLEIENASGLAWQLLSNIFHKREKPEYHFSNGTPNRLMTPEEIQDATNEIKTNYISDFDYDTEYQKTQDITVLKELYQNSGSNYEKLQIYRIMFNENSSNSVIKKFVNEAFHIENDYLFQLNPCEYDTVPQYIIDECDKDILEICPQG